MSNVFHVTSSQGLPLEIILEILKKEKIVVDWQNFYDLAIKGGWKYKRIRERVSSSVFEVYGPEYRDGVIRRLDKYHEMNVRR